MVTYNTSDRRTGSWYRIWAHANIPPTDEEIIRFANPLANIINASPNRPLVLLKAIAILIKLIRLNE